MAGLSFASRDQLNAIALMRWQVFVNSLRSVRGRLNLVSRGFGGFLVTAAALGGGFACGAAAWGIVVEKQTQWLAAVFWLIFLFWQLFPVMATAFTQNFDASALLRFPLSYPAYFLVRLVYGSLDIATALGMSWSLGLLVGIISGRVQLLPWALTAVAWFVIFNLLLARMIFAWIEHWLSSRHSREVVAVLFLLIIISLQLISPLLGHYSTRPMRQRLQPLVRLMAFEKWLPPGLPAQSLFRADGHQVSSALRCQGLILVYCGGVLWLLHVRLHDQYHGENPTGVGSSEVVREQGKLLVRPGWKLPVCSGPVSAVFEKELRYFSRSGPMLFTLVMPVVMLLVLWGGKRSFLGQQPGLLFPMGAAYCLLIMTNIVYNSFGGDGSGTQFFFFGPVSFRQILLAKNLAQGSVLALEILILWVGVSIIYRPPQLMYIVLTFVWYLLAAPLNFMIGNLLSVYSPKRIDYSTFGRQRASETTILASLLVQFTGMTLGVLAVWLGLHYGNLWIAIVILLMLALPCVAGYFILLSRIDGIARNRRETLASELCRA